MTKEEFIKIKNLVEKKVGIQLEDKQTLVEGRLDGVLARQGFSTYSEFLDSLSSDITGTITEELVNALTTNHTYFMREKEHFDLFYNVVLPELKDRYSSTHDLRIWCGASSTGEEPYTLAMLIRDFFAFDYDKWDTKLLATDVSTNVLRTAIKGIYTTEQISPIPESWKRRYFKKIDDTHVAIVDELREQVLFRQFNLMSPLPFKAPLHVVFLRNVLIYFDKFTKTDLINRIFDSMAPGGYLFVGTTECVDRTQIPFEYVQPSVYRKPLR